MYYTPDDDVADPSTKAREITVRVIPGLYRLEIHTAKSCCVRFLKTPFGMAWMTDIDMIIDTPSTEEKMETVKAILNSLEAVPYMNIGGMEPHAEEANRFLQKVRESLLNVSHLFYDTCFSFSVKGDLFPDLSLVQDMTIKISSVVEDNR